MEAIAELVDAELIEDEEYRGLGETPVERVKALLGRLHSVIESKRQGFTTKEKGEKNLNKFIQVLETIFDNLPRPKKWRAFYLNDLSLITDTDPTLREWAIANRLNKSQTKAFNQLKKEAPEVFEEISRSVDELGALSLSPEARRKMGIDSEAENIKDLSASDVKVISLLSLEFLQAFFAVAANEIQPAVLSLSP